MRTLREWHRDWPGLSCDPVIGMCVMLGIIGLIITLALEWVVYG